MNRFFFILILMLVVACKSRTVNSTSKTNASAHAPEDFDLFFKKFKSDSIFQIGRVKFPWKLVLTSEKGDTVEEIKKAAWKYDTFHYEKGYASRDLDAYTQGIKNYGDSVKIELRGVDNGIQVDYTFVRESGKWFLQSGKDFSD